MERVNVPTVPAVPPRRGPRARKVGSREVVRDAPNFRSQGRLVEKPLLRLLCRLQEYFGFGQVFASVGALRRMLLEDEGCMAGVTVIERRIDALRDRGLVVTKWIQKGQLLPDGEEARVGTRQLWIPRTRHSRRAAKAFNAKQDRRAKVVTKYVGHDVRDLMRKLAPHPPAPPASVAPAADPYEQERARQLALAALWSDEQAEREPDKPDG